VIPDRVWLSEFARREEQRIAMSDGRFQYEEVKDEQNPALALPIVTAKNSRSLPHDVRMALGLVDAPPGPVAVVGGGLAQRRSAAAYRDEELEGFRVLVRGAVEARAADGTRCVALYVPDASLAGFLPPETPGSTHKAESWWTLDLGEGTHEEWLASLPSKARYAWRRDQRIMESHEWIIDSAPLTSGAVGATAHLLQATMRRNGEDVPEELAAWTALRRCVGDESSAHFMTSVRERDETIAVLLTQIADTFSFSHTVGFAEGEASRDLYQVAAYLSAVQLARSHGCTAIGFGPTHDMPKRLRRCVEDPQTHVAYLVPE